MEINHFSHQHPLRPMKMKSAYGRSCSVCESYCSGNLMYECKSCEYRLDERCLVMPQKILSPYHPHLLYAQFNEVQKLRGHSRRKTEQQCFFEAYKLCKIKFEGPSPGYECWDCGLFFAHQECCMLKLPLEIQHPSHQCFLTLNQRRRRQYVDTTSLNYSKNCKFTVMFDRAIEHLGYKDDKQLYHFSHRHPLQLTEQTNEDGQIFNCSACGKPCLAPTYGCLTCQYFLHQTCIDLPLEIRHFFHPCLLFLRIQPKSFSCGACDMTIQGFYFHCEWCNFSMDIECALLPTRQSQSDDQEQFCHTSHGHPLTLSEIKDDHKFHCSVCRRCSSGPAFVCRRCSFFLDRSCFDHLQPQIQYSFHPHHPLVLRGTPTKVKSVCNVCCKNLSGPTYRCLLCEFEMHIECSLPKPTVSYNGHHHRLLFLENIDTEVNCSTCDTSCDSCVFHCVECDFNLHLLCGPLPCTIEPKCHYHPFILADSPLEDESDQFCCDVCEKERDPRLSVYHCKKCRYPAEARCVISEVVLTLKGNCGDVELRTLTGQITGKLIDVKPEKQNNNNESGEIKIKPAVTLDDMLASFSEGENPELERVLVARRRDVDMVGETSSVDRREDSEVSLFSYSDDGCEDSEDSEVSLFSCSDLVTAFSGYKIMEKKGDLAAQDSDGNLKLSLFSDRAYKHFIEKLNSTTHYTPLKLWEGNEQVVDVSGNLITQKFAPILNELCANGEGFSEESTLSPRVKNYFTIMLCGTMHSMSNTRILDISSNLLLNWWNNLKILKLAGFNVQFALDHLAKVMPAYFGLQVEKSKAELHTKITNISAAIEQLTRKLKELKETGECLELATSSKSDIIKDCLTDASTSKWRLLGSGLH